MTVLPAIPVYLDTALDVVFGLFQPPAGDTPPLTAVLICAPWGWDEVASYRSRRHWAERLAAAGHPTLRFDLPATGNSGGMPADPARVESWVGAISSAAEWLRETGGGSRVAILGLGLGGLLAREAVSKGAPIEEMALWASPGKGRSFVREMRAFSRLQEGRPVEESSGSVAPLPDGWLETGGFVLSAETLESLESLDPELATPSPLRRALLLERDGIEPDRDLQAELEGRGVEVTVAPGDGWGKMVGHPERTKLPLGMAERVAAWLRQAGEPVPAATRRSEREAPAPISSKPELDVDGRRVRESPLAVPQPYGNAFGVLTEPTESSAVDLCVVFFNAGAVRHTGPNRLWVEASRRWAARGVATMRVDLEGIGEADGDDGKRSDVASFYVPDFEEQVEAVLDFLEERGVGKRFLLVGLCASGYWSFRVALRDSRAQAALLLNAGALTWHANLLNQREARKLDRVYRLHWWGKLLRGEVGLSRLWVFARLSLVKAGRLARRQVNRLAGRRGAPGAEFSLDSDLDRMRDSGTRLVLAFSEGEPLHTELEAKGVLDRLDRWPNLELGSLPGSDHTLRPAAAQIAARELIDSEVERSAASRPQAASGL